MKYPTVVQRFAKKRLLRYFFKNDKRIRGLTDLTNRMLRNPPNSAKIWRSWCIIDSKEEKKERSFNSENRLWEKNVTRCYSLFDFVEKRVDSCLIDYFASVFVSLSSLSLTDACGISTVCLYPIIDYSNAVRSDWTDSNPLKIPFVFRCLYDCGKFAQ